jgi:hypothetical protein
MVMGGPIGLPGEPSGPSRVARCPICGQLAVRQLDASYECVNGHRFIEEGSEMKLIEEGSEKKRKRSVKKKKDNDTK